MKHKQSQFFTSVVSSGLGFVSSFILTQSPSLAEEVSCSNLIFPGATFTSYHIYPSDPNLYIDNVRITKVIQGSWSGISNEEAVSGAISGSKFPCTNLEADKYGMELVTLVV